MTKRSADEKISHYRRKLRKLEEKQKSSRRRRIIFSDSESSDSEKSHNDTEPEIIVERPQADPPNTHPADESVPPLGEGAGPNESETTEGDAAAPELDPEVLLALGAKTEDGPEYGDNIHANLAQLWTPLLKKGLTKEDKEKLLKEYLVPQNCTLLQAPKLNPEISAAITESSRNRDKKVLSAQQQLGAGVTAVNRAMDLILNSENDIKLKTIKYLSDACRILCDLHYTETQTRIKLITPSLDKSFVNVVQDSRRDETLFGNKLSEKIKASKTIEKQGFQIKKTTPNPAPSASTSSRPAPPRGNWSAPPRYPKGGRGGAKKNPAPRKPPSSAPATAAKATSKPQTRGQTRQQ
ncbi:uncharacterized protein LOC106136164 [Amyelois transitella]|uniref:uncharacterized protein LOC106136164 n=1 Tax=Amyelois transitella TaxID=680683 RepID=UPI00298FA11A|nr:uncharacterized protein LOC106136164 [Amyelois transitella]